MTLQGKVALVTGASQSIGLASARALAADGATVVIMGRGVKSLTGARDRLRQEVPGARIEMFAGDACREEDVKAALDYAHGLQGRLDILVPAVGGGVMEPILMRDVASVRQEFEVNYISVFLMVRYGAPLLPHGGAIVCISTVAVNQPFFGLGLYGAAKAAVERLVRAAALELGGAGIRINAVRPGMTVEKELAESPEGIAAYAAIAKETLLGRVGIPEDIARVVRFLAGPESGWVTGQSFSADGGQDQGKIPDTLDAVFGKEVMDMIRAGKPTERPAGMRPMASTSLTPPKE
jgi:NAD(P)-dependent dehydrogenase (short-subunit alcohol dehydrogenase family)